MAALEGGQPLHLLRALVLATVVLCFVYLVFPVLDDGLPRGILAEVLLVLPHELRVALLLLDLAIGQQTQYFVFVVLLGLLDARYRLLNGTDYVFVLFAVLQGSLLGSSVLLSRLDVFFEVLELDSEVVVRKHLYVPVGLLPIFLSLLQVLWIHLLQHRQGQLGVLSRFLMLPEVGIDCADVDVGASCGHPVLHPVNFQL